ncbi:uncharacterized protein C8Q71DRAFT_749573 [Rhodofomes roseus]|uniref:Uncharacterized protein n=1 Tax=Rhodofomes roseus TaxID=34475 RepID=A0ABQ8KMX5_9APHY|nr:uncharacterized protein C8Q71DRAFT_749573 [Rhodofomes roseus]KAH9839453.1 hypothetical protein C8Q71DRAFT_749573 [Rhodofomes roseus]
MRQNRRSMLIRIVVLFQPQHGGHQVGLTVSRSTPSIVVLASLSRNMHSSLAQRLHIAQDEPCLLTDFAHAVHNSSASIRASPVVALESFHLCDQTTPLFTPRISGKITHQFLMISVDFRTYPPEHHPWTYLRIDFDEDPFPNGSQLVALSDDHDDLRGYSKGLGRIAAPDQPVENGPSLDDIVSLLEAVHGHTFGGYTCFSRMWLTESILLSAALKHAQHWSAGYVRPKALRRYAELESDVATCTTGILYHDPGWLALD